MPDPCSRLWEIDPYREGRLGLGDARSFERHLRTCEPCRSQLERDERLRARARALPDVGPSELSLRRLRARVLHDAATGVVPAATSRRWRLGVASLVIATVGASAWAYIARRAPHPRDTTTAVLATSTTPAAGTPSAEPADPLAGAVVPTGAARWSQARARGVEQVVLDDGVLRMHVRPQVAGERFLVMLPDGELEVRGTTFEVHVQRAATTYVHVDEGVVEGRLRGRESWRLGAGETWSVGVPLASAPPVHAARPTPVTAQATATTAAPTATGTEPFAAAIGLLRNGRYDEAASAFHSFVLSQPDAAQAEDASFLEAVALARSGRSDAAALAAEHHLARFPASFHRKDASILVARAAAQRGDCNKARTLLAPWVAPTPDAEVQATLRPCEGR
jgi:hypothetical protein